MDSRRALIAVAVACFASLPVAVASAAPDTVDLLRAPAVTFPGAAGNDQLGSAVASAGDVNGDGIGDLLLGAPAASPRGVRTAGAVAVVFGRSPLTPVDLAHSEPARGFVIEGAHVNDRLGRSVAALGDVNGDGLGDVAIGAPLADPRGRRNAGAVFVVFGKRDGAAVKSASLGNRGFRIAGAGRRWLTGISVAGAGDVNGDGRPDVLLGADGAGALDPPAVPGPGPAPVADATGQGTGAAFVVWGKSSPSDVDLGALGANGYEITGAARGDLTGAVVANAGDLDGDARPDQIVAAPYASPGGRHQAGRVWVLHGRGAGDNVALADLTPADGWTIDGAHALDRLAGAGGYGTGALSVGDVDGDGQPDIAVSAWAADPLGRRDAGAAWVVSGASAGPVDLASGEAALLTVYGARSLDVAGRGLAAAGDVDSDGLADLAIGAPGNLNDHHRPGVAFVVLAAGGREPVDLAARGSRVIRLVGGTEDRAGTALATGPGATLVIGRVAVVRGRTGYNAGAVTVVSPTARGPIRRRGTTSNEVFEGGSANDDLAGENGNDAIFGFGGDDRLDGGQGSDRIYGGDGIDVIEAGDGRDQVFAGDGNDTINVADHLRDVVDCGAGDDSVRARAQDKLINCEHVSRVR